MKIFPPDVSGETFKNKVVPTYWGLMFSPVESIPLALQTSILTSGPRKSTAIERKKMIIVKFNRSMGMIMKTYIKNLKLVERTQACLK